MRLALRKETNNENRNENENKKTRKWKRKLGVTWFLYMSSMYGYLHSLVFVCVYVGVAMCICCYVFLLALESIW